MTLEFPVAWCFLTLIIVLTDRQDYSHSSDMAVRGSSGFKLWFYPNLNVRNIAQEWVQESRRLFYLRTANNVTNNIYKGSTPLRAWNVQNELSEDRRGLNDPYLRSPRERVSSKSIVNRHGYKHELVGHRVVNKPVQAVPAPISVVDNSAKCLSMPRASKVEIPWRDYSPTEDPLLDKSNTEVILEVDDKVHDGDDKKEKKLVVKKVVSPLPTKAAFSEESLEARKALASIYDKVLVIDNIESARSIVKLLTTKYKSFIHACDTEVKRNPTWLLDLFAPMEWSGCPSLFI